MKKLITLTAIIVVLFACNDPKDPDGDKSLPPRTDTPPPAPSKDTIIDNKEGWIEIKPTDTTTFIAIIDEGKNDEH